ncbi:hypothetical protein [Streptomyces tauricus]|uniref:hypothetical protein n=1 Tax=Streptomyces tauricus TaxID=68274 RepID=UPI0034133F88
MRAFLPGPCCPAHTPAALAGKPEAPETTSIRPSALPPSPLADSRVADQRAIASGKRRASRAVYLVAKAATSKTN